VGWFFGGKNQEPDEEEEEIEPIAFKGALNGVEPDVKANARLLSAGLGPAKDLVTDAVHDGAESIRLEPKGPQAVATMYIDGMPQPGTRMSKAEGLAVTQTLKLLAGLDIKVRNKPQTGAIKAEWEEKKKKYQIWVSVVPVQDGERLMVRCHDESTKLNTPAELGMSEPMRQKIREFGTGTGVLLVCGPSGSGTTMTMFGVLRGVDPYLYSVYTIGDALGRTLEKDNVTRFKQNEGDTLGTTFDRLKRMETNVLHIDPIKTAEIAQTVFEKHDKMLYIAEIPAKDVASAVQQLYEWVGDPKLVAEGLRGIISQKLLRALCQSCRQAFRPKADFIKKAGLPPTTTTLYRKAAIPEGDDPDYEPCEKCNEAGYRGRIAMFEFLVNSDEMKELIAKKAPPDAIKAQMRKEKQITFQSDAIRLIAEGRTSLEEVQRVMKQA
jgi:type IV pilus assembly protein PilB